MHTSLSPSPVAPSSFKGPVLLLVLAAVMVSLLAVSPQSLWIDEANSAMKAVQPTWTGFVQIMASERGSDLQMPFYMVSLWGWEKLVGQGEYALRAMNVPLFLAAVAAALWGLSISTGIRQWFCLWAVCSPMVWTYLDEARPYSLQFLASTLVMVGLVNLAGSRSRPHLGDAAFVFTGIVMLCGSSLMGVIYSFFFGLAFLACWLGREPLFAALRRPGLGIMALLAALFLAGLGIYYLWTLKVGARASGVGKTNILSMAFCAYELLGFTGVGPGRAALRDNPVAALRPFLPFLALYAFLLTAFFFVAIKSIPHFLQPSRWSGFLPVFVAVLTSGAAVMVLGLAADFRVIGRHLMPLLPFLLIGLAGLSSALWVKGGKVNRGAVVAVLFLGLISCVSQRTFSRFAKDDYRSATNVVREAIAGNGTVWWAADEAGANYYGVFPQARDGKSGETPQPSTSAADSGHIYSAIGASAEDIATLPSPDVVILSKVDIYDPSGALRAWMKDQGFATTKTLPAFTVWEKAVVGN